MPRPFLNILVLIVIPLYNWDSFSGLWSFIWLYEKVLINENSLSWAAKPGLDMGGGLTLIDQCNHIQGWLCCCKVVDNILKHFWSITKKYMNITSKYYIPIYNIWRINESPDMTCAQTKPFQTILWGFY